MVNNNYKKKIFFLIFCFFLIKADFVLALEQQYPPVFGLSIGNGTLPEYAKYFFNIGMAIAGILAAIVIAFGGIYYLVSLGMGKFTDEGKQWIKAGVLGLLLTVSSYLIAYTINPNLVVFNLNGLLPIPFNGLFQPPPPNTTPFVYYNEIPIGTLTENLLSRTMDCYDFDSNGDPIEGKIETDDNQVINGPTLLEHDRVDCFLKLTEAADKKAELIENLSSKIADIMKERYQCSGCSAQWNKNTCSSAPPCEGTANCEGEVTTCNLSLEETKKLIEHGPIKIGDQGQQTDYSGKEFKGLDEFRTQLTNVSNFVEIQPSPKINKKEVAIINNGNCQICDNFTFQGGRKDCLKNSRWGNLKLIEQLMYLREKMNQIKTNIEKDRNQLQSVENTLGQCYLAEPYIDFLKTVEKTKKEDKTIIVQKTFNDPVTQKQIDVYKYCKGFDYANSKFYSQCQNICPETMEQNLQCYKGCKGTAACLKGCYNSRPCPAKTSPFATFKDCIQGFSQQCLALCDKKYSGSQKDFQKCQENCNKDSSCLLNNEDKCIVNFPKLKTCADKYNNPEDLKTCINNSFLCKYGSDQYAGYPDCIKNQGQYSSPFLYQNPNYQKCKNPYSPYKITDNKKTLTCVEAYPETAKCPTASMCPACPCGIIDETITSSSGGGDSSGSNIGCGDSGGSSNGENNNDGSSTKLLEYQIVTGNCNESSYNDDPLTFYCQQNWWNKENKIEEKNPTPIGKDKVCSKKGEIPVGQTIDDTEKWANDLLKKVGDFMTTTDEMIQYIKTIGREQNYCQCNSTCSGGQKTCNAQCQTIKIIDEQTSEVEDVCLRSSCSGNPCQKMIELLLSGGECGTGKGVDGYYKKINEGLKTITIFVVVDARTDVLKELSYSRKKMNEASTVQSAFGKEAKILSCERVQDEIVSPIKEGKTRVGTETTKFYCYGRILGKILKTPEPLADNWFFCEERQGINE